MRILLLGATGNLGSRLLPALLAHKHTVTVLIRSEAKLRSLIPTTLLKSITIVTGDASSASLITQTLLAHDCDAVINSAGQAAIFPWEAPRMQHIVRAVVQGAQDAVSQRGGQSKIRAWFLGGMTVLDYPAFSPRTSLSRYFPLFTEHALTWQLLRAVPGDAGVLWSMFCPSAMSAREKVIGEELPEKGNRLVAEKDVPADFRGWGLDWIPFLGPLVTVLGNAARYNTSLEDCADWIAEELERGSGVYVGHRVSVVEVRKEKAV